MRSGLGWNPPDHLISEATRGVHTALGAVLERTRPEVLRVAVAGTGDPDEAEDVTQEVLINILLGIQRFRSDALFSSWVYRIYHNELVTFGRRRQATLNVTNNWRESSLALRTSGPRDPPVDFERFMSRLRALVDELPSAQRRALELVDFEGLRPVEAARLLDKNPVTLRASLCKGRRKVRGELLRAEGAFVMEMLEGANMLS